MAIKHFQGLVNLNSRSAEMLNSMYGRQKLKYLMLQRINKVCIMLIASGRLCECCDKDVRSRISENGKLLGRTKNLITFEYFDLHSLTQIVL